MKFTDIEKKEVLKNLTKYQYDSIINWNASDIVLFNYWIYNIEKHKLDPTKVTLPYFYK
mgnify:CR=1 FL=1